MEPRTSGGMVELHLHQSQVGTHWPRSFPDEWQSTLFDDPVNVPEQSAIWWQVTVLWLPEPDGKSTVSQKNHLPTKEKEDVVNLKRLTVECLWQAEPGAVWWMHGIVDVACG